MDKVYMWQKYINGMNIETERALIKLKPGNDCPEDYWIAVEWSTTYNAWYDHTYRTYILEENINEIMFVD